MTIKRSKLLGAIGISCGPFVVTIGHFVMSRNEPFPQNLMPFCLLLVSVLVFVFGYFRTPAFYVKDAPGGLIIAAGAKQGMYDPDFIEFSKISSVTIKKNMIFISLDNGSAFPLMRSVLQRYCRSCCAKHPLSALSPHSARPWPT